MKLRFTFYLLLLLLPTFSWSQNINEVDSYSLPKYHQSISFKPFNYSNIDLMESDEMGILQMGIEYERLFKNNRFISFVLPFTYTRYYTGFVTDYNKSGNQIYITPGVKYYFNDFDSIKGFAVSTHLLLGHRSYEYSSELVNNGTAKGIFGGLLLNGQYNLKISQRMGINTEIGFGIRYMNEKKHYFNISFPSVKEVNHTSNKFTGIMNFSIGFNYRFK